MLYGERWEGGGGGGRWRGLMRGFKGFCEVPYKATNKKKLVFNIYQSTFIPPNLIGTAPGGGGGGYSQKNWVGVCGPLPKILTLFMTKICNFPYPIYDPTKNLIPYL